MADRLRALKAACADRLKLATTHKFTEELCNGTLSDSRLFVYLTMDLEFFLESLRMLCRTAAQADSDTALLRLGKQVGMLSRDENEYFDRTLAELKSQLHRKLATQGKPDRIPAVDEYIRFCGNTSRGYAENITAIYVFELVYQIWAENADQASVAKLEYKHKEWVRLHSGPDFAEWVEFLENEVVNQINDDNLDAIESVFKQTVELEILFWDSCYDAEW